MTLPLSQQLQDVPLGYPVAIEKSYAAKLRGVALRAHRYLVRHLRHALAQQNIRLDEVDPLIPPGIDGLVGLIAAQYIAEQMEEEARSRVLASLDRTAEQTARYALRAMEQQLGTKVAPNFPTVAAFGGIQRDVITEWTDLNAMLIGATGDPDSIPNKYFSEVADYIQTAQARGQTVDTLSGILADRYGVARSRANLIARTELAKLNGQITEAQQKDVGITSYTWETSRDQRVRETHRQNQGQAFSWQEPPPTGHPGQDFACRCIARPTLPDWARQGSKASPTRESVPRFQE